MPTSPSPKQIEEWCESAVAEYLVALLNKRLDTAYQQRAEAFISGEPVRTQEIRANLLGQEAVLDEIIEALEAKNLSQLEEPDDERVRNSPPRRPHSGETGGT
jgi:hypothetical protein